MSQVIRSAVYALHRVPAYVLDEVCVYIYIYIIIMRTLVHLANTHTHMPCVGCETDQILAVD